MFYADKSLPFHLRQFFIGHMPNFNRNGKRHFDELSVNFRSLLIFSLYVDKQTHIAMAESSF